MAKKDKWTEPELPEVEEVEEEIVVEETVVESEPEPEPEREPVKVDKGEVIGYVKGRPVYKL